jgi:hypothetical protein
MAPNQFATFIEAFEIPPKNISVKQAQMDSLNGAAVK